MVDTDERFRTVLTGYSNFLRTKELALPKHQPYLIRWVKEFLHFARAHAGYTFEQTLDLFLAEIGGRVGVKPWQIQQAADAVRIYRYQYRGAGKDAKLVNDNCTFPSKYNCRRRIGTILLTYPPP